MRLRSLLAPVALLALACASAVHAEADPPTVETLKRDLRIEARLDLDAIQIGQSFGITGELVNRSKTATYPVVAPGDGSDMGWREPHVFVSAERQVESGAWEDVPRQPVSGRCKTFDQNWHDEVRDLAPAERIDVAGWQAPLDHVLPFAVPGKYRLRLNYTYRGGHSGGRDANPRVDAPDPGPMGAIPAYELHSDWLPLDVRRGLELELAPQAEWKVGEAVSLSALLGARLVNHGAETVDFVRSDWEAYVWADPGDSFEAYREVAIQFVRPPDPTPIAPGASVPAFEGLFDPQIVPVLCEQLTNASPPRDTVQVYVQIRERGGEHRITLRAQPFTIRLK